MRWLVILFGIALMGPPKSTGAETALVGRAAELYQQAATGKFYAAAARLHPDIFPTSDGKSFFVVWQPTTNAPGHWIVSLPGTHGFATDDLALWQPQVRDRNIGLICMQWWLGSGDATTSYYTPEQLYREIER